MIPNDLHFRLAERVGREWIASQKQDGEDIRLLMQSAAGEGNLLWNGDLIDTLHETFSKNGCDVLRDETAAELLEFACETAARLALLAARIEEVKRTEFAENAPDWMKES